MLALWCASRSRGEAAATSSRPTAYAATCGGDRHAPQTCAPQEAAQAADTVVSPHEQDAGDGGGVNRQDEQRVGVAHLAEDRHDLSYRPQGCAPPPAGT